LDTLHLETRSLNSFDNFNNEFEVTLVNPNLTNKTYKFEKANTLYYFNKIDTLQTKVLAIIDKFNQTENEANEKAFTNVIKQSFGDGDIILSAFPQAFTNYFILKDDCKNYTSGIMSYINMDLPIYSDSHYKSGKTFYTSPMYLFLNTKELKWAYYIVLIGALIYIIFEGKRKQRAIPIITPLRNKTLDFTRTISNMYYESSKHKDIAHHKIQHFLEYIRTHLHLGTSEINDSFIEQLASRSNNSVEDTQRLFETINTVTKANSISETRLERLNTLIEQFKSNNQWKTKT
jgi:hypothetical protein